MALVLEDDALISGDLPMLLDPLQANIVPNEIILLCYCSPRRIIFSNFMKTQLNALYQLAHPIDTSLGITCGYIITHEVAKNMVLWNFPIKIGADWWGMFWSEGYFENLRCILPMVVKPNSCLDSDVGYEENQVPWRRNIKPLVRKYDIAIVNKVIQLKRELYWWKRTRCSFSDALPHRRTGWSDYYKETF